MTTSHEVHPQDASTAFERGLVQGGTSPAVAAELERRIGIVEHEEAGDVSRLPLSAGELTGFIGVAVGAAVIGVLMVLL